MPDEAGARVGPMHRHRVGTGIDRDGDAIGAPVPRSPARRGPRSAPGLPARPVAAGQRVAVRMSPLDVRDAARVDGRAGEPAIGAQRAMALAQSTSRATNPGSPWSAVSQSIHVSAESCA